MTSTAFLFIAACASALSIASKDEPWSVSASGHDGRVRVTVTIYRDTVAPGEVAGIHATSKLLVDGPVRFPTNHHQPLAFLYIRTPAGKVMVYPERGVNPRSCRVLEVADYRQSNALEKGAGGRVIRYDIPLVNPSPGWLEPRTYEPLQPNLRMEGIYEVWVQYTIPKLTGAAADFWHGSVETEPIRFTVREIPVADRRAEPTAEQIAHLDAYVRYYDVLLSHREVKPVRPDAVEMPPWLAVDQRLKWALERTENEGLARHTVAILREHLPKDKSQPYPRWWDNVCYLVWCRAYFYDYGHRFGTLKIVGPYLDEFTTLVVGALEHDLASATNLFNATSHLDLLLSFAELKPKSPVRQRLETLARRHAKIPVGVRPGDRMVGDRLEISWRILYALGVLCDEMAVTEATDLLGEPTVQNGEFVGWGYDTGSRKKGRGVTGKLIVNGSRQTIVFTNRNDWTH